MQWELAGIKIELEKLWNIPNGPQWSDTLEKKAAQAIESFSKTIENVGFYHYPDSVTEQDLSSIEALADEIRSDHDGVMFFGIGGSHLGPLTILESLHTHLSNPMPYHWVYNLDPPSIEQALNFLKDHNKVASVVISKSGGTLETLGSFFHLYSKLDPRGIAVITDPESGELRRLAGQQGWKSLSVPPNIGGRFSVLTPVGLFPAALMGIEFKKLIEGAKEMKSLLESFPAKNNPAMVLALAMQDWQSKGKPIQVLMPYWSSLERFAHWNIQLWAESLGKISDSKGPVGLTPFPSLGSRDQHSLLQLFKEGPLDKVVGFIDIEKADQVDTELRINQPSFATQNQEHLFTRPLRDFNHLACKAVETSLERSKIPTYRIEIPFLDAKSLGSLFYFYQVACGYAGELYEINAFNQPGVEEAKRLWKESLI